MKPMKLGQFHRGFDKIALPISEFRERHVNVHLLIQCYMK